VAELVVYPTIDGWVDGLLPDTNTGTGIVVGEKYTGGLKGYAARTIGNFDVSALAGVVVQSAQIERYVTAVGLGGFGARIYRVVYPTPPRSTQWTEGGLTYNKYDGVSAWTLAGGDFDLSVPAPVAYVEASALFWHTILGLREFVVDALANRAGLLSILMKPDDEVPGMSRYVEAKDRTAVEKWLLRVTYGVGATPGRRANAGPRGERELEFDNLRGVRPARERRGVGGVIPVGGVA
jgi:hypothetical protein